MGIDTDGDFQIHGAIGEMSGGALSSDEVKSNLRSAKKWRTLGVERSLAKGDVESRNDASLIEGFSQGADQCFSTCVVAWAAMQEKMSKANMTTKKDALHSEVGDVGGTIVVLGQKCRNGRQLSENIVNILDVGLSQDDLSSGDLEVRHTGQGEINAGEREGDLLKAGGGLVLQDGAHFRLAFMENDGAIKIFDPLGGRSKSVTASEVFDYVSPRNESTDKAAILELNAQSDFVMM